MCFPSIYSSLSVANCPSMCQWHHLITFISFLPRTWFPSPSKTVSVHFIHFYFLNLLNDVKCSCGFLFEPLFQCVLSLSGQYDARARVLIRHVSCLLRVSPQEMEEFEETLGERLRGGGEESEWVSETITHRTTACWVSLYAGILFSFEGKLWMVNVRLNL